MISSATREDAKSANDSYEKPNKVVEELQREVDEHGLERLKICDFPLKQNDLDLKEIRAKMINQLPDNMSYQSKNDNSLAW